VESEGRGKKSPAGCFFGVAQSPKLSTDRTKLMIGVSQLGCNWFSSVFFEIHRLHFTPETIAVSDRFLPDIALRDLKSHLNFQGVFAAKLCILNGYTSHPESTVRQSELHNP
jgi:hypothetical protein